MAVQLVHLLNQKSPLIITGGLVVKGAYDNATDYAIGDSVDYNGSSYVMYVNATAGTLPTDTTKWQVLAEKGATGATGAAGTNGTNGTDGDDGTAATVTVGTTNTIAAGSPATVTNSGTTSAAILDFDIPAGPAGADGADGLITSVVAGTNITVDNTDPANPIINSTATSGSSDAIDITYDPTGNIFLASTDVQNAIGEVDSSLNSFSADIADKLPLAGGDMTGNITMPDGVMLVTTDLQGNPANSSPDLFFKGADMGPTDGGGVVITGGSSYDANGGHITLNGGLGFTGNGKVRISNTAGKFAYFDVDSIATTDKTYTLPNATGTFALTSDIPSDAIDISYDSSGNTTIMSTNVEDALDSIDGVIAGLMDATTATDVTYDNSLSGLTAPDVQSAIDEVVASMGGGGGQEPYTHIVAPSGGDFTTLGGAIAGASAGDSIFIRSGTYTESAITTSLANLTIIGENNQKTILDFGSNILAFSGNYVKIKDVYLKASTGQLTLSGSNAELDRCYMVVSGVPATNAHIYCTGTDVNIARLNYSSSSPSTSRSLPSISCTAVRPRIVDSFIMATQSSSATNVTRASLYINGANSIVTGNIFYSGNGTYQTVAVRLANFATCSNNQFANLGGTSIWVDSSNGGVVSSNVVEAPTTTVAGHGIYLDNCSFVTVTGNYVRADSTPTYVGLLASSNGSDCILTGNFIGVNTGNGMTINSSNAQITGNRIARGAVGTSIAIANENCLVANNHLSGFSSSTSTAMTDTGKNTNIIGNLVQQNATGVTPIMDRRVVTMRNTSGAGLAEGAIVVHKAVANGYEVTTTTTAGDNKVFGVVATAIANTANAGPILVEGKTVALKVDGTTDIAVGDYISCFTTAGIGAKANAGHTAIAIALEAYTTDDSNGVIDALVIAPRVI